MSVQRVGFSQSPLSFMEVLPPEVAVHVLSFFPDANLADLRLTDRNIRDFVDKWTSWPLIHRVNRVFNSLKMEHIVPKLGLTYAVDLDKGICTIQYRSIGRRTFTTASMFPGVV